LNGGRVGISVGVGGGAGVDAGFGVSGAGWEDDVGARVKAIVGVNAGGGGGGELQWGWR
jgi:hypothetical protein